MTLNGNPSLRRVINGSRKGKYAAEGDRVVSMGSMIWKSVLLCAVTIISAIASAALLLYFIGTENAQAVLIFSLILLFSAIPLIIVSFVIMFFPGTAKVLSFVYCILEGLVMGVTSALLELFLPGIALTAFIGTALVFIVSCVVFSVFGRKISGTFIKFVLISFISIILLEGLAYLLAMVIPPFAAIVDNIWVQLAVSGVMVLWAAFMILVDLKNMQLLVDYNADKKYEWLAAFSLVTTLIWLYYEILELIIKFAALAKRNN